MPDTRRAIAIVLVGLVVLVSDVMARDRASGDWILDERTTSAGVTFRYVPPAAEVVPAPAIAGADRKTIEVAGAGLAPGGPGTWQVPVHTAQILLPEGSDWSLDFTPHPGARVTDAWFPRVTRNERFVGKRLDDKPIDTPPTATADGITPEAAVTGTVEIFRGRRLLLLTLAPLQFDPIDGSADLIESIDVTVRFHRTSGATSRADQEQVTEDFATGPFRDLVLNPDVDGTDRDTPLRSELIPSGTAMAGRPEVYFDDAPAWIKLGVTTNGIHRVTASALAGTGASPASIDPATIRMFAGPGTALSEAVDEADVPAWGEPGGFRELAILVKEAGAPNGRFDDADTLLFYGLAVDNFGTTFSPGGTSEWLENENTGTNTYWLTWGGTFPEAPLRMVVDPVVSGGTPVTTVLERTHVEQNDPSLYDPLPREEGIRWEKWWWQQIEDTGVGSLWEIPLPDIDTTRPLDLRIRWWGSNIPDFDFSEPTQQHFLRVSVNSAEEVGVSWGGGGNGISRYDMNLANQPARAVNQVTARVINFPNAPLRIDQILLAWMEFTWWHRLNVPTSVQSLAFEGSSAAPGPVSFDVSGSEA
ncbi:MAG TPA: hypothetical protein VF720_11970, partial [Candidatus Eisenbacteria bacterium]